MATATQGVIGLAGLAAAEAILLATLARQTTSAGSKFVQAAGSTTGIMGTLPIMRAVSCRFAIGLRPITIKHPFHGAKPDPSDLVLPAASWCLT
jgi:hypothetical protein